MLVIAPDQVDLAKASASLSPDTPFDFNYELLISRTDPDHPNYSPSGVYGDPSLASYDKGQQLLQAHIEDLQHVLQTFAPETLNT